jgi:3'-phosphoadenosine 5'-phosphosulfate sulfotransferase (PAPS reductase)/FAD synthetase
MAKKVRHVLGISGGKDSAALAIYLKQKNKVPDIEYFFTDTGVELPEIYTFLDKLEIYLGRKIKRLGFDQAN